MDAEALIWLIFIAVWFISAVVKQLRELAGNRPGRTRPGQGPPAAPDDAAERPRRSLDTPDRSLGGPSDDPIKELLRQLGGGEEALRPEQPVPSEHRPTPSEHRRTPSEHRGTIGEDVRVPSEHRMTPSEQRGTIGEDVRVPSEHRMTRSEHRKGDVRVKEGAEDLTIGEIDLSQVPPTRRRRRGAGALARAIRSDLRSPRSTAKAILLREILGPPPGLRAFGGTSAGAVGSPDRPR